MYGKQANVLWAEAIVRLNFYEFKNFSRASREMVLDIWPVMHKFRPCLYTVNVSRNSNIYHLVKMVTCLTRGCCMAKDSRCGLFP